MRATKPPGLPANAPTTSNNDPWLRAFNERQRLEAELQKLEIEELGIKVTPAITFGKDESDCRKERIEYIKRDIGDLTKRLGVEDEKLEAIGVNRNKASQLGLEISYEPMPPWQIKESGGKITLFRIKVLMRIHRLLLPM